MEFSLHLRVCSISPQTLEGLPLHFDKMFSSVRGCAKHIAQSCKLKAKSELKVMGLNIEFHVHPIFNLVEYLSKLDDVRSV